MYIIILTTRNLGKWVVLSKTYKTIEEAKEELKGKWYDHARICKIETSYIREANQGEF